MSGSLLKSEEIETSEFESVGSKVKIEINNFDERPESSLGDDCSLEERKEDENHFKDEGDEEFIRDATQNQIPSIDDEIDIKYEGLGNEYNSTSDAEDDNDLEIVDRKLNKNVECKVRLERMSESEFQRHSSYPHEVGTKEKDKITGLRGSVFRGLREFKGQDEVVEEMNRDETPSVDYEINKYELSSIEHNSTIDTEDDLDPDERVTEMNPKPGSRQSIHSDQREFQKLYLDLLQCDRDCETCLFYIRKLSEHVRATHLGGEVRQSPDPLPNDLLDLGQSSAIELKTGEDEDVRRMESSEEFVSDHVSDSDPNFETESGSESDPDYNIPPSKSLTRRVLRQRIDKLNHGIMEPWVDRKKMKEFSCDTCGRICMSQYWLTLHEQTHTRGKHPKVPKVNADSGRKKMQSSKSNSWVNTKEIRLTCETCSKCFQTRKGFKEHKMIHSGERPFKCEVCGKGHITKSHMRVHLRIHTGDRPYKCGTCDKAYMTNTHLNQHLTSHSEISHECDVCEKSFKRRDNLAQHKKIHGGEKAYKCDVCDRRFMRSRDLTRHELRHQKLKK